MKAPFPWFGGKSRIAHLVWRRFGNVPNYVEPFFGSGAVLLARPHEPGTETVNDIDGFLCNFWRAVADDPDSVALHADWPVNENDLHARHAWLTENRASLTARLEGDPLYYDAQLAGWWVWGINAYIGGGFCSGEGPWKRQAQEDGSIYLVREAGGKGIKRQLPHLGDKGQGINRKLPHLGDKGQGIRRMFEVLGGRLRGVRVACGDFERVLGPSITTKNGVTGVFLDPPYDMTERRAVYALESENVADRARLWAIKNGDNPKLRIALCGYDSVNMPENWTAIRWKAAGGYGSQGDGRGRENAAREVVWFSPACVGKQTTLF